MIVESTSIVTICSDVIPLTGMDLNMSHTSFTTPESKISLKKFCILTGMMAAWVVKVPRPFNVAN